MTQDDRAIESDQIRIYVGTDRSQLLGARVLEHSIAKHTIRKVAVHPLLLNLPQPKNKRNVQRTGFSFSRFAVPELAGYRGKAIYMDADMLVFKDIGELWDIPFDGTKILIQEDLPNNPKIKRNDIGRKRVIQNSVSLMDCSALSWDAKQIIEGLEHSYNYAQLMHNLCILEKHEIGYKIPFKWNSLEYWDENTCNLHFTDMNLQPWVSPRNKLGYLWLNTLKEMIDSRIIEWEELEEEVSLGYARPSLLSELQLDEDLTIPDEERTKMLDKIDKNRGFIKHKEVKIAQKKRRKAEAKYIALKVLERVGKLFEKAS